MSGITTGTGLFSGIDTQGLITQLLAIEARPKQLAQQRILQLQQQQAAYLSINTALSSLQTAAGAFNSKSVFDTNKATSSDPDVLTAVASTRATAGTYNFTVNRLVSTQQQLSRGFNDADASGVGATKLTFEVGGGSLTSDTSLAELNAGNGVSRGKITITESGGGSATIDLSTAGTITEVVDLINQAGGIAVKASVDGDRIVLKQSNSLAFSVSSAVGYDTAEDLGIAGSSTGNTLTGSRIRTIGENTSLATLNDGTGVMIRDGAADIIITDRAGKTINVDLGELSTSTGTPPVRTITQNRASTLGDVVRIINDKAVANNSNVRASIDTVNNRIVLTDSTGSPTGNLIVQNGANGRTTAAELGLLTDPAGVAQSTLNGKRLVASLNSSLVSSLKGGVGVSDTELTVTDRAGNASGALTISASALSGSVTDLVANINSQLQSAGVQAKVSLNRAGNGLQITDTSGGTGNLVVSGAAADTLGLATVGDTDGVVNGVSLQTRWIGRATKLEDLNVGRGVGTGSIRITNSSGSTKTVSVGSNLKTVDDLVQFINSQGISGITASINANGDGLVIQDTSNGSGKLKIEDSSGTVAKALNLVGEYEVNAGVARADGSYEQTVELTATDTLNKVVEKIRAESVGVTATVINDGGTANAYRVSFTSQYSGKAGRVLIDSGDVDLGLDTLSRGDDAKVFFGSSDPAKAVLLTSSTNILDNVVQGVTIDLNAASSETVEVTVTRDNDGIEKAIDDFVKAFNGVLTSIKKQDSYDPDSNVRGPLLADTTASNIRNMLLRTVQGSAEGVTGTYTRLFQVGVRIGSGAQLEFDRERFRTALDAAPDNVKELFAARDLIPNEPVEVRPGVTVQDTTDDFSKLGVGEQMKNLIEGMINRVDGRLTQRGKTLDAAIKLQTDRIASIDQQLETKKTKLERDFLAMEQAIAQLQGQQSALSRIQSVG